MKKMVLVLLVLFSMTHMGIRAQENDTKAELNVTTDIVSSYIWRGMVADPTPNIQPGMVFTYRKLTVGAWASTNFTGTYQEVDLYVTYEVGPFSLTVNDYCWDPNISSTPYFEYNNDKTGHIFEGSLLYTGGEKFPIKLTAATCFYGADKKWVDGKQENQYSTFIEAGYPFNISGKKLEACVGFTPEEGMYGNGMGIMNLMLSSTRDIKISDQYNLRIKGSLSFTPQQSRAFFMLTISL